MTEKFHVSIVGGGVIGCAIAFRLATEGKRVLLVEGNERLGAGASSAALGGIIVETDDFCIGSPALGEMATHSRRLFPAWVRDLSRRAGMDVPILTTGDIQVALSESERIRLEEDVLPRWHAEGFAVERLTSAQIAEKEPLLTRSALAGYHLSDELAVEPPRLMAALSRVLPTIPNLDVRLNTEVSGVDGVGGVVKFSDGTTIESDIVVVAGGYATNKLVPEVEGMTFPVRGQAFELRRPGCDTYPLRHHCLAIVEEDGVELIAYVVPRSDGRMAVGVTYEEHVRDECTSDDGQRLIERGLSLLVPSAVDWPVTRRWAGIRPGSDHGTPLIGRVREGEQMIVATGHYGLGVTLAPVTAELVSALINGAADERALGWLGACDPMRSAWADGPAWNARRDSGMTRLEQPVNP